MTVFALDPAFEATSVLVADLPLCQARLQLDRRWAWLVLVPRIAGLAEIEDLSDGDRHRLTDEIVLAGAAVRAIGRAWGRPAEKLNVGALGNVTRQLHVHVVGRRADDAAWPGPVWGFGPAEPPDEDEVQRALAIARTVLGS